MTYSLGYVASRSPEFARRLVRAVAQDEFGLERGVVRLQTTNEGKHGRTDVEVQLGEEFFGVFEAKRGPWLPTAGQLGLYSTFLAKHTARVKRLVAVTNTPEDFAALSLPKVINGIPVHHLGWRTIKSIAESARADENHRNKHMLDEFVAYLREILGMETSRSNMVYLVSVGPGSAWGLGFREVVEKWQRYFYPVEGHWPSPPNYIAFRYDGKLQSIHHVDGYDLFTNPKDVFEQAESTQVPPHYCLRLGPGMRPAKEVKNGPRIRMSMRVWCMIDTLLTSETITDAMLETKRRLGEEAPEADE